MFKPLARQRQHTRQCTNIKAVQVLIENVSIKIRSSSSSQRLDSNFPFQKLVPNSWLQKSGHTTIGTVKVNDLTYNDWATSITILHTIFFCSDTHHEQDRTLKRPSLCTNITSFIESYVPFRTIIRLSKLVLKPPSTRVAVFYILTWSSRARGGQTRQ